MRRRLVWFVNGALIVHFIDSITMHPDFGPAWGSLIAGVGFIILDWRQAKI